MASEDRQVVHTHHALNERAHELLDEATARFVEKEGEHGEEDWLDDRPSYHANKSRNHVADAYLRGGTPDGDPAEAVSEAADAINHLLMFIDVVVRGGDADA